LTLHARGLSLSDIARALGVTRQYVHQIVQEIEHPTPPRVRTVTCEGCGQTIAVDGIVPRDQDGALCLNCLAKRPDAPFGQRLKAFRLAAGLTKAQLADRAGLSPAETGSARLSNGKRHSVVVD
jgi:DNA-binding XRE family transcriptional regulator